MVQHCPNLWLHGGWGALDQWVLRTDLTFPLYLHLYFWAVSLRLAYTGIWNDKGPVVLVYPGPGMR